MSILREKNRIEYIGDHSIMNLDKKMLCKDPTNCIAFFTLLDIRFSLFGVQKVCIRFCGERSQEFGDISPTNVSADLKNA